MNIFGAAIISTGLSLLLINSFAPGAVSREIVEHPISNCYKIEDQFLVPLNTIPVDRPIDNTINQSSSLPPTTINSHNSAINLSSFWWAALQFDPFGGKLVQNWLAYPQKQQINLVVNWKLWTLLDYFGRYRFVNQFGTVARKHGYSLHIYNQKNQCLASYKYNPTSSPPKWELNLEELGRSSLPLKSGGVADLKYPTRGQRETDK